MKPTLYTENITLVADYHTVVTNSTQFLTDCSNELTPVQCVGVWPGSIILLLTGDMKEVQSSILQIETNGLSIPGYDVLYTSDVIKSTESAQASNEVVAAGAGSGFSSSMVIIIAVIVFIIAVLILGLWPYRQKLLGKIGILKDSDLEDPDKVQPQLSMLDAIDQGLDAMSKALEANCDINECSQSDQSTAVILTVVRKQDPEMLRFLAENNADLNIKNAMGIAACHYAARDGLDMHLQCLMDHNADMQATNLQGFTPLQIAKHNRRGDIVSMLKDYEVLIACGEEYSSPPTSSTADSAIDFSKFPKKVKKRLPELSNANNELIRVRSIR